MTKKVLITGGCGFIGSHLARTMHEKGFDVTVLDNLTYAGNVENLENVNVRLWKIDINDLDTMKAAFENESFDIIVHMAAESHVDRSIENPLQFARTNVIGTCNLLEIALDQHWKNSNFLFYHVSTDEVFGSIPLDLEYKFDESTSYYPQSPYSASKASSDHFVRAYHNTYGLPIMISNCSNNYGTHQYDEKFIPSVIRSLFFGKSVKLYGDGLNMRDWLHVNDHVSAILTLLDKGIIGETYCIGGHFCISNKFLAETISWLYNEKYGNRACNLEYVQDRKGHDKKYDVSTKKLERLGWKPIHSFNEGMKDVIDWYVEKFKNEIAVTG